LATLPALLAKVLRKGDYLLPPGGSSVVGTLGYLDGAAELALQVRGGVLPRPDLIVVPLGSGGTAAGLLAGLAIEGLPTKVLAVRVVEPWMAGHLRTVLLARLAASRRGHRLSTSSLSPRLEVQAKYLGAGYGYPTMAGHRATEIGKEHGLALEPTYTAKTFAAVLDVLKQDGPDRCILYWHTFSSAPLAPLLLSAPDEAEIPTELQQLLLR
jgi:D-cysteine desulfhydrase